MKKIACDKIDGSYGVISVSYTSDSTVLESGWWEYISTQYGLSREDICIWDNYGTDWLVVEKKRTENTYFCCTNFLFLDNVEIGDFIDFGDTKYCVTGVKREPSPLEDGKRIWVTVSAQRVLKSGKKGKSGVRITYFPTVHNERVNIKDVRSMY